MRSFTPLLTFLLFILLCTAAPAQAWLFGSGDTLVTIDGISYSKDDFKRWWQFWNDEKLPVPATPDVYIDWLLLAREGERMELDTTPGFRRQAEVYRKSRSLLLLKNEEVNSRIVVSDEAIRQIYERDYLPRWLVQRLEFRDDAAAQAAWQELSAGTVALEELIARTPEQGGPVENSEDWLRPYQIHPWWAELFTRLEPGGLEPPGEYDQARRIYHLKERKGGDDDDLAKVSEGISRKLWKQQENALTHGLLASLREKYQVVVDEERLKALALDADDAATDALVISTNRQSVTEKDFLLIARRHMDSRGVAAHALLDADGAQKLKDEIVAGIIAQNVVDWEALDRRYEERDDLEFKWEYAFYLRHQLVLALEQALFIPAAKVSDEEIQRHYAENPARYTQPSIVRLIILDDTQGPVQQVWAAVAAGTPFSTAVSAHFKQGVAPQEVPANHLDPSIKAAVDKLTVGETSPLITAQGSQVLVHLLERTPETLQPLEKVVEMIRKRLTNEKIDQLRRDYLDTLKARSRVEVRTRQWKTIQKELGGA
jgi:hypothetical protein